MVTFLCEDAVITSALRPSWKPKYKFVLVTVRSQYHEEGPSSQITAEHAAATRSEII